MIYYMFYWQQMHAYDFGMFGIFYFAYYFFSALHSKLSFRTYLLAHLLLEASVIMQMFHDLVKAQSAFHASFRDKPQGQARPGIASLLKQYISEDKLHQHAYTHEKFKTTRSKTTNQVKVGRWYSWDGVRQAFLMLFTYPWYCLSSCRTFCTISLRQTRQAKYVWAQGRIHFCPNKVVSKNNDFSMANCIKV